MAINTLYSFIYIKSDKWGTLNWGHLSPASDNKVVLADISGTVIELNSVFFEGASFILRPKGTRLGGYAALDNGLTWGNFLLCQGLGAGLGTDCFGAAQPAVRYEFTDLGRLLVPDVLGQAGSDQPDHRHSEPGIELLGLGGDVYG